MNWQKQMQNSVARRLALSALFGLAVVLIAVGAILAVIEHRSTHALMVTSTAERVKSMVAVADTADQLNRSTVLQSFSNFRRGFERTPSVNESSGEMTSAGSVVNDDFQAVDKFTRDTQGVALVFAKKGNSFVCISTSLRNRDGARAMDMGFDNTHAAYLRVMEGEAYTGRVTWFDRTFMAYYEPLKNSAGNVVGVFVIGNDVSLQDRVLEHQIADVRIFEDGGMYFIDAAGSIEEARFLVHPTAKGKKVLEVYPQAEGFLEALQNSPDGYVRNAPNFFNAEAKDQWAVMRKTKSGGGWLVAEVSERESMAQYWSNMRIIWGLLIGTAALLGAGLFILVRRTVSAPLGGLTSAVTLVAQGDLTQVFQTGRRDEIGSLINEVEGMRKCYLQALSQVRVSVDSIGNASAEIASGSQDLSARTEQAASNLQRTASSMAQLTGTVELSAEAARKANELATSAAIVAAKGGAVVSEVVATMNDINQSSKKISDITSLIDGIAFQTNILALNAAVEAARAGDQGRGFAVVASEVRSLAQRSASAAKEIKLLIGASVERVESGSRLVETAGSTMDEIVSSVQRVRDIMEEISAATAGQSAGIGQVNIAVNELDQMTQQNAALVEQSAAASESLRDQANNLAQAVSIFKLNANPEGPLS